MKKLMLLIAISFAGNYVIKAQDVAFGVKAGVNFANVSGDVSDNKGITSFHVGGIVEFAISEKFIVQPELLYSEEGFKIEDTDFKVTYKLGYINIPVMAKYVVADGFSIEAGPQIGFLLSAKEKAEGGGDSETNDIKDLFKSNAFGVNFGLGYKLDNGLNFGARYNLGLSNILEDAVGENLKSRVFQVSVGYLF